MNSQAIMLKQLDKNENSAIMKQAISKVAQTVQQRVYWLNTSQMEGDFMQQYWEKQVTVNDVMKKRIGKITQQKFQQLFAEINQKKVTPMHGLQVFPIQNLNLSQLGQDIPIIDHSYFTQNHPKTIETKAKVRQIKQDYLRFKEKIQQIKRKQQQKKRQKQALDEQIRRSLQKQKKQKIRQHAMKTIEQKNHKKQQRKQQNQKYKQFLKVYRNSKPLHLLMEQHYKQKIQLPILQQNKRKLDEYKQNHTKIKPSLQQINQHQKSYLQAKYGRQSRLVVANQTIDVFKSKFYLQQQKKLRQGEEGYQTMFDQLQKKKRYSQLVKQNFKPKISVSLRKSINQSQLKSSTARESLDRTSIIQKGKEYLQFMRSLQKNRRQHSSPSQKVQKQQSHRYINYLQALKQSRQVEGNQSKLSNDWQRQLKNKSLSQYEKRQRVLLKSKQLEEKAYRKQQFINNNHFGKAQQIIQRKKQIDQTLISSIRAKVAVLRDVQKN